jgi:tetratricopeptide (TPR) repeat protein
MVGHLRVIGRYDEALVACQRACDLAAPTGDSAFQALVTFHLGEIYRDLGDLRRAADTFRLHLDAPASTPQLRRFGLTRERTFDARALLAWALCELGDFDEAVEHGLESVRISEASGETSRIVQSRNILSRVYLERGDAGQAVALVERALDLAVSEGHVNLLIWSYTSRGVAHLLAGEVSLGTPLLERGVGMAIENEIVRNTALWATWLGEAYLAEGRIAEARQTVRDAVSRATAQQERGYRAYALRALGEIAASEAPANAEEAEGCFCEALTLAEELEMRPLQARCHLGLGELYRRVGRVDEARAALSTAIEMLRDMEMTFWLPEAEGELTAATASQSAEQVG